MSGAQLMLFLAIVVVVIGLGMISNVLIEIRQMLNDIYKELLKHRNL